MKKAIYLPTNQNTVVISEFDNYFELLLDGDYKTVPKVEVKLLDSSVKICGLQELKENIFINCIKNPINDILYSLNSERLIPEPHQYKPLTKFLNSDNNRLLIADEVGLGKTIEAGMIFKEIKSREDLKVTIIVVPASLTYKWKEEFRIRFEEFFEIKNTKQFLAFIDDFDNYSSLKTFDEKIIINYHVLRDETVIDKLKNSFLEVDFLIMDEAHSFRNNETSTFEGANVLTSISDHILFLTATPVQNDLRDVFNVLSLLDNESFMDFDYFRRMIKPNKIIHTLIGLIRNNKSLQEIKAHIEEFKPQISSPYLNEISNEILRLNSLPNHLRIELIDKLTKADHLSFIVNRTKKRDVGRLLPRNVNSIVVNITKAESDFYNAVIDFVVFIHPNSPPGFITIMPERMASSSMLASFESFKKMRKEEKLFIKDIDDLDDVYEEVNIKEEGLKYLDKIIERGVEIGKFDSKFLKFIEILNSIQESGIKQIIVFSFFKNTLNYLADKLLELNYKIGLIHGDYSVEERYDIIKSFRNKNFDILLSSEVGSEGLDMQFCNVIINYDLPWNPMRVEQRIGRIDRIGQKFEKLHIFNLCITGSIEDRIYLKLYNKLNIFKESIGELEPVLGNLEKDLNISELLKLSDEEIDQKIHLQELAIKRQELEIKSQTEELEKLINEDYIIKQKQSELLNSNKIEYFENHTSQIVLDFLEVHNISYTSNKNGELKISKESAVRFNKVLRSRMSDKKLSPTAYMEERNFLQNLQSKKQLTISFNINRSEDFHTLLIFSNHSLIKMILKDKMLKPSFSLLRSNDIDSGYVVIYRADLMHYKNKSWLKTIITDESLNFIKEYDFFELVNQVTDNNELKEVDFENIKRSINKLVINQIEKLKQKEIQDLTHQIEIKEQSIKTHFDKKIKRAAIMERAVDQQKIKKMRIAERDNLIEQKELKLQEIRHRKNLISSFEILAIMKIN